MIIDIDDECDSGSAVTELRRLAAFLLDRLGMAEDAELSVSLVDVDRMSELHEQWLDEPGPTDVISIPMDELREPGPGDPRPGGVLGDIVICPPVAEQQAATAGHSPITEMQILLTHGVLHLLGHDHADPQEAEIMFARQGDLLADYQREQSASDPERQL